MAGGKDSVVKHSPQGQETKDKDRKAVKPHNLFGEHPQWPKGLPTTPPPLQESPPPNRTTNTTPLTHKASVNTHDANGHTTYISALVLEHHGQKLCDSGLVSLTLRSYTQEWNLTYKAGPKEYDPTGTTKQRLWADIVVSERVLPYTTTQKAKG